MVSFLWGSTVRKRIASFFRIRQGRSEGLEIFRVLGDPVECLGNHSLALGRSNGMTLKCQHTLDRLRRVNQVLICVGGRKRMAQSVGRPHFVIQPCSHTLSHDPDPLASILSLGDVEPVTMDATYPQGGGPINGTTPPNHLT